tara:strand:- start:397 stop:1023 length:627 start_codon:yes stop_codon:yes gene_type:complete
MGDFKINEKTVFTQSGSAEPAMGSTITGIPAAGVTGVLPVGVTGGSGLDPRGVAVVDSWRVTSSLTVSAVTIVTDNWERVDTEYGDTTFVVGTGLTTPAAPSATGVFTFPETGIYLITAQVYVYGGTSAYNGLIIQTADSTTNFADATSIYDGGTTTVVHSALYISFIFNCSNVSTHKFRIKVDAQNSTTFYATTGITQFGMSIIKLN